MSTEVPGQPWEQSSAPTPESAPKVPRQKRKARAATPAPEKVRKPKADKIERAAPETIKVTMKEYAAMKVGEDAKAFIKMHGLLSALSKASRAKVLTELQKVFG